MGNLKDPHETTLDYDKVGIPKHLMTLGGVVYLML